jgi:AraC-like DNA-binding protein
VDFELNLRSILLFIALIQGFVITFLLLFRAKKQHRPSDLLLAGLLFFLACSMIEHLIGFAGVYDWARESGHDLTFFPFSNILMYGPLIYLYTKSLTDAQFRLEKRHLWHFLAPFLNYVLYFSLWSLPFEEKSIFFQNGGILSIQFWTRAVFYGLTFWYLGRSVARYRRYRQLIDAEFSNTAQLVLTWLRNFLYGFLAYLGIDLAFNLTNLFVHFNFTNWYWLELIRAIHLYYLSVTGWAFAQKSTVFFEVLEKRELITETPQVIDNQLVTDSNLSEKLAGKPLFNSEETEIRRQFLANFMEKNQPWLEPELTLSDLAAQTKMNTSQLSWLVNQAFQRNFNDFVNEFRVESVKTKLNDDKFKHLSLLGIAFECGFNSKATFNRAFKKITGVAPSSFLGEK